MARGGKGRRAGAAGSTAAPPAWNRGREGGRGRKEKRPDRWGHPVSDSRKKEKERWAGGPLREKGGGPWAGWAGKEGRSFFLFFFSFKTLFKFKPFQLKTFQNFSNFFHKNL
jgi:hypothetical protein